MSLTQAMDDPMTLSYAFDPLPGPDYIRILRLNTRLDDGRQLIGSLLTVELRSQELRYTAVSYSWGRNSDGNDALTHTILIDERSLSITENLYDGLMQLSKPGSKGGKLFWIDAICINQNDSEERNFQVSIMGAIYSKASSLVIWLGHGSNDMEDHEAADALFLNTHKVSLKSSTSTESLFDDLPESGPNPRIMSRIQRLALTVAFEFAETYNPRDDASPHKSDPLPDNYVNWVWPRLIRYALAGLSKEEIYWYMLSNAEIRMRLGRSQIVQHLFWNLGHKCLNDFIAACLPMYEAIVRLFTRRYFKRRWVLQEIYHSDQDMALMHWGKYSIRCTEFKARRLLMNSLLYSAFDQFAEKNERNPWLRISSTIGPPSSAGNALSIKQIENASASFGSMPRIIRQLYTYVDTTCADERDLVYALLGFAKIDLTVDYNLSAEQVFITLASRLIADGSLEDVLAAASHQYTYGYRRTSEVATSLPSWVPDFRCGLPGMFQMFDDSNSDAKDAETNIVMDGKCLKFVAKVGRLIKTMTDNENHTIQADSYVCQVRKYIELPAALLLRPVDPDNEKFVLVGCTQGHYDQNDLWERCSGVGMRTVELF